MSHDLIVRHIYVTDCLSFVAKDYGLFLPHEDNKKGLWLDNSRSLEHYILRNGVSVTGPFYFSKAAHLCGHLLPLCVGVCMCVCACLSHAPHTACAASIDRPFPPSHIFFNVCVGARESCFRISHL